MIITCPACNAQAQLPDSKEGAKVRCGECGRVYKATGASRRASTGQKTDPTKYFIIGGAVLLLFLIWMLTRGVEKDPPPAAPDNQQVVEEVEREPYDWNAPSVQQAVKLHQLANSQNKAMLKGQLDGQALLERLPEEERGTDSNFKILAPARQNEILEAAATDLVEGDLVAGWKPFDGWVVPPQEWATAMPDNAYVVRLKVSPLEPAEGLLNRHVEWHFLKVSGGYKAFAWQRWISPEEIENEKKARAKRIEQKTLSDGSQVVEGKVREIPYMDETPQEVRDRVEELITEMLDPESRPFKIIEELKAIGKPAIPGLLTRMAQIPIETEEQIEQLNLIHRTLTEITGHQTTFRVSLLGATEERQESGVKQWFGWYERKFKRFTKRPEPEEETE